MPFKDPAQQKAYRARWHAENYKGERATNHRKAVKLRRKEAQEFVSQYKAERGCQRCPEKDPVCLDLHHEKGEKEMSLCTAALNGWSKERILKEAEKCEVLCSNCHRKHHAGIAKR